MIPSTIVASLFWSAIMRTASILLYVLAFVLPTNASAQGTRLLRDPDVSKDKIVFVYANDLWTVGRNGGDAKRLTSDEGSESNPSFSPDGKWIAFTGQYAGNTDVYVVQASGGQPKRLTWHPVPDVAQGWTPDGQVLFQSSREGAPTRLWNFFKIDPEGGFPTPIPLPQAYQGEMSPNGKWIAYQEIGLWDAEWRNYRGGQAQPIGIVSTDDWERIATPWEGERHLAPVWLGGTVYYLSERDYASNVWSFNPKTKVEKQLTHHSDFDVKSVGAGAGLVVYEQGGYLYKLNPKTGKSQKLLINVAADLNYSRPRWEEISANSLRDARLSPTGKRAIFESRGELFTVPTKKGSWRNITRTSGVADRHAVWSPDGQQIAWFNDAEGEYQLVISNQAGEIERTIEIPDASFFFRPTWSPDGKKLAFTDTHYRVWVLDLKSEELQHVDTDGYAHPERSMNPVWSPDSKWIAYARRLRTQLRVITLFNVETEEKQDLTDGMADSIDPVWDASGKYIYFLASTNYALNIGWLDMTSYDRPITRSLYVAILNKETKSPFLESSDEEEAEEEKGDEKGKDEKKGEDDKEEEGDGEESKESDEDEAIDIDFDGIELRILDAAGASPGNLQGLVAGPEGHVFIFESDSDGRNSSLKRYSVNEQKSVEFAAGARFATVSNDRKKILVQSSGGWKVGATAGGPKLESLAIDGIRAKVDPRLEWNQMLREGWRYMRDFLYVDNVHGAPWDEVWQWYSPWLEHVHHRSDFNYLLDILSGEVAVGHSYVVGGDMPDLPSTRTGLLGCDLELVGERYKITKILTGERWTPGLSGPLSAPGLSVNEGDYLLAIDGSELKAPTNPFELLEGLSGKTITLLVNDKPTNKDAREIVVKTISSENQLRTWNWVATNQKRVDELSDGKLAYVWLPNTGQGGYTYFNRMYFAQQDREGAVIDERNNGGGSAADYIVEVLGRELTGYFNSRSGEKLPFTQPMAGLFGPKVMVINERAGSGGDLLPYLFRFKEIGPLVGTKTWGGLVGTWDTPPLIDGGRFVAPRGGFIDVDGNWAVEGEGVAPDIEIRNDPKPVIDGKDPQLERAVEEALRLLKTQKVEFKPEPEPPIRYRRPEPK